MKATNNLSEYIAELKMRLVEPPMVEGYELKLTFSEVHSLLLSVKALFLFENLSTTKYAILVREWNPRQITHELGLYFFDQMKFETTTIEVNNELQQSLRNLLNRELPALHDFTGIILDGSAFTLHLVSENHQYQWKLPSQLEGSTKELVDQLNQF